MAKSFYIIGELFSL